ncbi:MAG: hypothetical protein V1777_04165 [Candidatus Micrarchaeota archaeon]
MNKKRQHELLMRKRKEQKFAKHHERTVVNSAIGSKIKGYLERPDIFPKTKNKLEHQIAKKAQEIQNLATLAEKVERLAVQKPETRLWLYELLPPEVYAAIHAGLKINPAIQSRLEAVIKRGNVPESTQHILSVKIAKQAQEVMNLPTAELRKQRLIVMDSLTKNWVLELLPEEIALELMN